MPQSYPAPGWVEHDPERIRDDAIEVTREVIRATEALGHRVEAIGLTNQRETTVVWERDSGRPVHPAVVWQDRRTADSCTALREAGHEPQVARRTGLRLDPHFSGTKLAWILDHVPDARSVALGLASVFGLAGCGGGGDSRDDGTAALPAAWAYEKFPDGSIRILWTIRKNGEEELVLMDSGFHPIPVPEKAVTVLTPDGEQLEASRPVEIRIEGTNSAFLEEQVTLRPYRRDSS